MMMMKRKGESESEGFFVLYIFRCTKLVEIITAHANIASGFPSL